MCTNTLFFAKKKRESILIFQYHNRKPRKRSKSPNILTEPYPNRWPNHTSYKCAHRSDGQNRSFGSSSVFVSVWFTAPAVFLMKELLKCFCCSYFKTHCLCMWFMNEFLEKNVLYSIDAKCIPLLLGQKKRFFSTTKCVYMS